MESQTISVVAEMLVKLGREDGALVYIRSCNLTRMFLFDCYFFALCAKGHARKAEGVVYHHKDKIAGVEPSIYRSLLYEWSVQENVKEAHRVIKEMKSAGGGDFEKGRELWDEAVAMGVSLDCSSDVLDPSITQVFKPTRKVEEVNLKGIFPFVLVVINKQFQIYTSGLWVFSLMQLEEKKKSIHDPCSSKHKAVKRVCKIRNIGENVWGSEVINEEELGAHGQETWTHGRWV
ncbi:pentatricopeptide repeat-containing protein [Corchorus olitorius]|uniref:Pentatricopeptide repeat-containing protein n=1 Tax=Corchorus olitorius TaxID=93759 RepID=A0A1R3G412_9ROSI|nr:pentatricopeptide repeat-containing protein [Corchorus olitorius]